MISIADVAKAAGVSTATVSRVLNDPNRVRPDTRARVLAVMEELNYRPNPLAQGIRRNSSGVIGALVPMLSPSFGSILSGIVKEAAKNGQSVLLSPSYRTAEEESAAISNLIDKPLDAVIYLPRHVGIPLPKLEYFQNIPIVGAGRRTLGFDAPCVYSDNEQSGYLATRYLIGTGRQRIAFAAGFLTDPAGTPVIRSRAEFFELLDSPYAGAYIATDRFRGYRQALEEANLPFDEALLFPGGFSYECGIRAAHAILSAQNVDGVVASNDNSAVGMIQTFLSQGYSVPEDISVVGFDDIPLAAQVTPALTTIHQQTEEIGRQAVCLVNRLLRGETSVEDVRIEVSLVTRASTVRKF